MKYLSLILSSAILLAVNAIPVYGVLFLGWDIFTIMMIFWIETVVIGIVNIPKILMVPDVSKNIPEDASEDYKKFASAPRSVVLVLYILIFPCLMFIFYILIHLINAGELSETRDTNVDLSLGIPLNQLAFFVASFFISHLSSFYLNFYRKKEYLKTYPYSQMWGPVLRIFPFWFAIFISMAFFNKAGGLVLVVIILKIIFDLGMHIYEHTKKIK
ncbi:MAG: DUF6498-containing protein [Patescibacteria group bacterium]